MEKSQVPYIKPYLLATIKRFISKLRNKGVKKDIKLLSNQSLNLLNDNSYSTNEKKPKNYYYEKLKFPWFNSIDPYNHYKIVWDLLNLLIILMFIFWIPVEISFQTKLPNQVYGLVVLIFSTDIALNFNTAYFHHGFITTQSSKIIKNYLFYDFFLDFLTLSTILLDFYENKHLVSIIKLLFLIRFKTLSKIYHHLIEKFRLFLRINMSFLDLINLLFLSMFILHYFACFWYLLADVSPNKLTWITHYGIENLPNIEKYFYSLYWSSVTIMTVGYGDICPQNISEMIFCIITIVFGCGLFAYIINAIGIIIGKINMENEKFNKRMNIIDKFMHRKSIDRNLQMKIREYFRFIWQEEFTQYSEKETDIINKLSKSLKEELYIEAHGPLLNKFPLFFANFTENTLKSLVFKVKEIRYSPEDIIYAVFLLNINKFYFYFKGKYN